MPLYHGKPVLLGCRVARLPNDEDLLAMKPKAAKYATIDAAMSRKGDIITIDGHKGEWLVYRSSQANTFNWRECHLHQVTGHEKLVLGQYSSLRIAYDSGVVDSDFQGSTNAKQVLYTAVTIVGKAQAITVHVRVPVLPESVGFVNEG